MSCDQNKAWTQVHALIFTAALKAEKEKQAKEIDGAPESV